MATLLGQRVRPADPRSVTTPADAGVGCPFAGVVADLGVVQLRDVSLDGVGLVLARPVPVGTVLAVTLANPAKDFRKVALVRVAHVTPIAGGFLAGGSFAEPLTYRELTALVM